ncbi:MAG: hypothetical protein RDU25_02210 [Patescibacteria group bacterium]|nr:hypothetical protein [Patescibacteria group bacterium]
MKRPRTPASIALSAAAGLTLGVAVFFVATQTTWLDKVTDKMKSIIIPKPSIGKLTPARDLRGTWISSLTGKGVQLYGKFETGNGVTDVYEDGDIELIIEDVEGNTATGQMRLYNVCAYGQSKFPAPVGTISVPKRCFQDVGSGPVSIEVSASNVDFGTFSSGNISWEMRGTYTTDLMKGTIATYVEPYGAIKGEFHLMRKRE